MLLIIEVSDTTVEYDRQVKVPLYAGAGIEEVWIVNLPEEKIEVYAGLVGGVYQSISCVGRDAEVRAQTVAGLVVSVAEVLG